MDKQNCTLCGKPEGEHCEGFKTTTESSGIALIAAERQRQIETEGWTPEHDAAHTSFELTRAAQAYAEVAPTAFYGGDVTRTHANGMWPWDASSWKPSQDTIRNLVKAATLLVAEIDRLETIKESIGI